MTDQYHSTNINNPRLPRQIVFVVALSTAGLTVDDGLVTVVATLFAGTLRLPLASEVPGLSISIQKIDISANTVTVIPIPGSGDSLLAVAGTNVLGAQFASRTYTSDGVSGWSLVSSV